MRELGYVPIEEYGVIGNLETCALVAPDGSIDWLPFPHIESPSVFAAVLDPEHGGRFRIGPSEPYEVNRRYVEGTNVLETTFETSGGTATVTDFLVPAGEIDQPPKVLYRRVAGEEGRIDLEVEFEPRFDYGRADVEIEAVEEGVSAAGGGERTLLESPVDLAVVDGRATGTIPLSADETEWFLLRCTGTEEKTVDPEIALADTIAYWRDWMHDCDGAGDCVFDGPWHELVVRSGLVLKLLTHAQTGAIAAAATTSLPETVGGVRNWDYRFNWIRDAGFTVQALSNLGHVGAAVEYLEWFLNLCTTTDPAEIQPLYGLHGDVDLEERELDHLAGYRDSRPVRIGNGAAEQTQLDIYGELLLAVDEMVRYGRELDDEEWDAIRDIVEYVREVWNGTDAGIWEVRGGERRFVYSKLMCWVALDRGIEIAVERGYDAPLEDWRATRETIRVEVLEEGYDEDIGAFVQSYGSDALDATGLLVPIVGFLPFDDDRVQGTIEAIEERLAEGNVLVHRYDGEDGLPGEEGAFVLCSCWLIDALALSGRIEEAEERFEALIEYVGPLGLMAEEIDTSTGRHLGNFPQGFSHIGLINSALYVGCTRGHSPPGPPPMGIRLGDPIGISDE
ncbi:MAG: glycoside hydrolase family 15 protein [Halalkalicoccus sp.]|nr:glycoside hydrolase family 15 protein [Halalkalicoccus sp.]